MSFLRYFQPVPASDAIAVASGKPSLIWLRWFQFVAQRFGKLTEQTLTYDPPNILAGGVSSLNVAFGGALPGDKAYATHSAVVAGIIILATATTDSVTVTFWNVTAGAIDLASGTLTVGVEST